VTIATWPDVHEALDARVVETMTFRLDREDVAASVDRALARADVVVIGPGFGKDETAREAVEHVLGAWVGPSVVDADALALFAGRPEVFASSKGAAVLTPHPGEMGGLLGKSARDVEEDRFGALAECLLRSRSVTLLKGAHTLVGAPDESPVINGSGTSALATAGSGDVLSGTIAALLCSLDPFEAAFAGAYLHGAAGEAWSSSHGDRGLLAHEIADEYPRLLRGLVAGR
jgi:NAD(P)H-hydrate epimerase